MDANPSSRVKTPSRRRLTRLACVGALLSGLFFVSTESFAATQGSTGPTSTGTVDITYTQGIVGRIEGFADMPLGTWSGRGPMTANENLCVSRNGIGFFGSGTYRILASGNGEPGNPSAFTLTNGADLLYYNVYFNDQAGTAGRVPLTAGVALTGQSSSGFAFFFNLLFGCVVQNANISIEVTEPELMASAGTYTGTLTLMLTPE